MNLSSLSRGLVVPSIVVAAACGAGEKPVEQAAPVGPNVVEVTATDYAFAMPDTLPSGVTTFRLINNGSELHHVMLTKIPEGMTVADFAKLPPEAPPPAGTMMLGGPNPAVPAGNVEATLDLLPGQYVVICVIPSSDGKPHVMKGMMRGLVVTAGSSGATQPAPDVTVTLSDYDFQFSTPLTAGRRVIRIENAADQPHELVFARLEAGKTVQDLAQWAEKMMGPPPATPIAGSSPMSRGISNTVMVELTPGDYALLCFVPDAKDGKPHLAHGMMKQITVN